MFNGADFCALAFNHLSFGEEPIFDVVSVLTTALLKQPVRALADVVCWNAGHEIRLGDPLSGIRRC